MLERRVSTVREPMVVHEETRFFIINSGAFYSAVLHRYWANISFPEVTAQQWKKAVSTGIKHWEASLQKKKDDKESKAQKIRDKEAATQGAQKGKKRKSNNGAVAGPSQ